MCVCWKTSRQGRKGEGDQLPNCRWRKTENMRTDAHTREGLRARETGAPTLVTTEKKERAKAFEDRGKRRAWLLSGCRGSRDIQRAEDGLKTKPQKKMMLTARKRGQKEDEL